MPVSLWLCAVVTHVRQAFERPSSVRLSSNPSPSLHPSPCFRPSNSHPCCPSSFPTTIRSPPLFSTPHCNPGPSFRISNSRPCLPSSIPTLNRFRPLLFTHCNPARAFHPSLLSVPILPTLPFDPQSYMYSYVNRRAVPWSPTLLMLKQRAEAAWKAATGEDVTYVRIRFVPSMIRLGTDRKQG